jgi:hypothetical protein
MDDGWDEIIENPGGTLEFVKSEISDDGSVILYYNYKYPMKSFTIDFIIEGTKCECGADACGFTTHSSYCPKYKSI